MNRLRKNQEETEEEHKATLTHVLRSIMPNEGGDKVKGSFISDSYFKKKSK